MISIRLKQWGFFNVRFWMDLKYGNKDMKDHRICVERWYNNSFCDMILNFRLVWTIPFSSPVELFSTETKGEKLICINNIFWYHINEVISFGNYHTVKTVSEISVNP